jgi:Flp pilus assembly protein TadD
MFKGEKPKNGFSKKIEPLLARAKIISKRGDHIGAILLQNEVIKKDPKNARAYGDRAISYYLLGRFKEAISDCTISIRLDCSFPNTYITRGSSYQKVCCCCFP